jgi:hypothetical protein
LPKFTEAFLRLPQCTYEYHIIFFCIHLYFSVIFACLCIPQNVPVCLFILLPVTVLLGNSLGANSLWVNQWIHEISRYRACFAAKNSVYYCANFKLNKMFRLGYPERCHNHFFLIFNASDCIILLIIFQSPPLTKK